MHNRSLGVVAVGTALVALSALLAGALAAPRGAGRDASELYLKALRAFAARDYRQAATVAGQANAREADPRYRLLQARALLAAGDCPKARPLLDALAPDAFPPGQQKLAAEALQRARTFCAEEAALAAVPAEKKPVAALAAPNKGSTQGMVRLAGGSFQMGSEAGEPDEAPPHPVTVSPFYIDATEVTTEAFDLCVAAGACERAHFQDGARRRYCNYGLPDRKTHPMNCVSWFGADQYCRWIGKRLPTEAEWEFAARGTSGRRFPWGIEEPDCTRVIMKNDVNDGCGDDRTAAVGSRPTGATPEGVHDLAGNVWEWCADFYQEDYYAHAPAKNPAGPARDALKPGTGEDGGSTGLLRVMRGGSWLAGDRQSLTASNRENDVERYIGNGVGFRCARND